MLRKELQDKVQRFVVKRAVQATYTAAAPYSATSIINGIAPAGVGILGRHWVATRIIELWPREAEFVETAAGQGAGGEELLLRGL
jgi:hypothetical protein